MLLFVLEIALKSSCLQWYLCVPLFKFLGATPSFILDGFGVTARRFKGVLRPISDPFTESE